MAIVSAEKFIQAARDNGYAIGGFNTNNLEWTQAILRAAEAKKTPVLIQTSMGAAKYMGGYKMCKLLVETLVESMNITVPVSIHLDHGHFEDALECIEVGYSSLMFDGSHLPIEENLKLAEEVIAKAHAKGISVECEVGSIGGEEDGIVGEGELAPIEDAVAMAKLGVDFLAAGIGNIHGKYPANWEGLSFETLDAIQQLTGDMPLVLHGGTGIPEDMIKKAIDLGVAKINVNTECQLSFAAATRAYVEAGKDLQGKGFDPRKLLAPGFDAIKATVKEKMELFGSVNKA